MAFNPGFEPDRLVQGSQYVTLPFNQHRVYVGVRVCQLLWRGKTRLESYIQFAPCCNDAPSAEELDRIIDDLHLKSFGPGKWIYTDRDYLPPSPQSGISCEEKSQSDDVLEKLLQRCKAKFESWKQKSETLQDKGSQEFTRGLKEEQATLKRNIDALNDFAAAERQVVDQLPGKRRRKNVATHSGVKNLVKDWKDTLLVVSFVAKVEEGVAVIKQQLSDDRSSSTGDYFNDLVEYRQRQQNEQNDNGTEFMSTLKKVADAAERRAKSANKDQTTTAFVCRFVSHLVQHLHRQREPNYSQTDNADHEGELKRLESVPVVICRIVNGLRKDKGAEALVVLNALVEVQFKASTIRDMSQERQDAFVSSAIKELASVDLSVPSHTRLFHPAVLVYWALTAMKLDFATICGLIELEEFSAADPLSELDALAKGWLSSEIPFAMMMPLSECEKLVQADNNPQRARDDEKSTPRVDANQRSFPRSPVLANVAGRGPTPGPHHPQSPGVDRAGDVLTTAAPALHNSPVVPVDSESGAADASLDGTQSPGQVFVGYQAGVPRAGHVSSTATLDNSAGGRSGYVDPAGLQDGPPLSMTYISSLEAMGTGVMGGSSMEMACIREQDTGAAPNSTGNDQWRYATTFGRVLPDAVWSGNDEFMGFRADQAMSPTSE